MLKKRIKYEQKKAPKKLNVKLTNKLVNLAKPPNIGQCTELEVNYLDCRVCLWQQAGSADRALSAGVGRAGVQSSVVRPEPD